MLNESIWRSPTFFLVIPSYITWPEGISTRGTNRTVVHRHHVSRLVARLPAIAPRAPLTSLHAEREETTTVGLHTENTAITTTLQDAKREDHFSLRERRGFTKKCSLEKFAFADLFLLIFSGFLLLDASTALPSSEAAAAVDLQVPNFPRNDTLIETIKSMHARVEA